MKKLTQNKFNAFVARKTIFAVPRDYLIVTPASSMPADLRKVALAPTGGLMCELCGHPIEYQYPIQNDTLKIVMYIGVDCADHFYGAGYIYKQIRVYQDSKLRQLFQNWRSQASDELWTLWKDENTGGRFINFQTVQDQNKAGVVICSLSLWSGPCNARISNDPKYIADHYRTKHNWYFRKEPDSLKDLGKRLRC